MNELEFINTRFKCYREMDAINRYIADFKSENKDFKDVLDIIRSFSYEERMTIFSNIEIEKLKEKDFYNCLKQYQEFEIYKSIYNEDLYIKLKKCEKYLEKESRYIKMNLVYIYTIFDECILELMKALDIYIDKNKASIIPNILSICNHREIRIRIDRTDLKQITIFNRIRNDFIHNSGIISEHTIKLVKERYKMSDEEIRTTFNLYDGEKIGLSIMDLRAYSQIANSILKKIYEAYKSKINNI